MTTLAKKFQSSPGAMSGCNAEGGRIKAPACDVSILTRRDVRVQQRDRDRDGAGVSCFNPHPARCPGATPRAGMIRWAKTGFNPHPARCPGATHETLRHRVVRTRFQSSPGAMSGCNVKLVSDRLQSVVVSILTRRDVRVQHPAEIAVMRLRPVSILTRRDVRVQHCALSTRERQRRFQSSPGAMSGCNFGPLTRCIRVTKFQSSPGAMSGCNCSAAHEWQTRAGFQSSPGAMSGCNRDARTANRRLELVSILTRRDVRVQLGVAGAGRARP